MQNNFNVRKIYIDTRYKRDQYGSNTNFEIDLPQTVECPEDTVIFADEIVIPNTMTTCLLYTSPSPRDLSTSRMPSSA